MSGLPSTSINFLSVLWDNPVYAFFAALFLGRVKYEPGPGSGEPGPILSYDTNFLLHYGWFMPYRGTFMSNAAVEGVIFGVVAAVFLSLNKCTGDNLHKCIPFLPSNGTGDITLLALASFLIGLFTNTLLNRWWALRMLVLGHVGQHNQVVIELSTALANGGLASQSVELQEEAKKACHTIFRYLNIANHLVIMNANKEFDYLRLNKNGLVTDSELGTLQNSTGSPNVVYGWVDARLEKLADAGFLGPFPGVGYSNLQSLLRVVGQCRASCIAVGVYVDTQLPYPLVQLVSCVIFLFICQLILVCAGNIGLAHETHKPGNSVSFYYTLVLLCALFRSLLSVYDVLYNPLGDDAADFPSSTWLGAAEKGMLGLINNVFTVSISKQVDGKLKYIVDENIPRTRTSLNFIQDATRRKILMRKGTVRRIDANDVLEFNSLQERWRRNVRKIHPALAYEQAGEHLNAVTTETFTALEALAPNLADNLATNWRRR